MASDKSSSNDSLRDEKVSGSSLETQCVTLAIGSPSFEDFLHFAALQRELEKMDGDVVYPAFEDTSDKGMYADSAGLLSELEKEKIVARRALRAVSLVSAFFLVTTDVLGPFNAPYAFAAVGFVPGSLLYFLMFVASTWTGTMLWHLFVKLDSDRYPIRTYGDIVERIYGPSARHLCNILASIQLIVNVGLIALAAGQALSQVSKARICFSAAIAVFIIVGILLGQIRTLKSYSWVANGTVWLNITAVIITMAVVSRYPPNIASAQATYGEQYASGSVKTAKFVEQPLYNKINGVMNMVYAYGGTMIFPEFMAEMRRPVDFWKGLVLAQTLIFTIYMIHGTYVYAHQGQYTLPIAFQGLSKYVYQTACNVLVMITMIIAAGLYGNIGIKLAYINIVENWFKGPSLMSKKGRFIWGVVVFLYWSLAFIIVSSVPALGAISGLIGAVGPMQFTYSFPPVLMFGYEVLVDATEGESYAPGNGKAARQDSWSQWSRWRRGLFGGRWYLKLAHLLVALAAFALAGLGIWGTSLAIEQTLSLGAATSFGCRAPV